jgi:integrase
MTQPDVYRMVRRRAKAVGIETPIGCHTWRATGITAYLLNGGKLEVAQSMAGHEPSRTTHWFIRPAGWTDLAARSGADCNLADQEAEWEL